MARKSGRNAASEETRSKAAELARGTQRPGQSKAQTKLIAQGIERGIDLYKKEQKAKARAEDRARRSRRQEREAQEPPAPAAQDGAPAAAPAPAPSLRWLPWLLLALTWAGIGAYWLLRAA